MILLASDLTVNGRSRTCLTNWQSHLHTLVTAGGITSEGAFTPLALPSAAVAEELFRRRVIRMLRDRGRL